MYLLKKLLVSYSQATDQRESNQRKEHQQMRNKFHCFSLEFQYLLL